MGIQKDIDVFLYRAQKRTATLGTDLLEQEDKGNCIDDIIDTIIDLDNAIYLFQNRPDTLSDDEVYEIISSLNKRGELTKLPLSLYSFTCEVENVVLPGGYVAGPQGPQGEKGEKGDPGDDGADGAVGDDGDDGYNGWTAIPSLVTDGARKVIKITGWTGGTGTAPAIDLYIGTTGLVSDIADAVDIRGSIGATGATGATGTTGATGASSYTYIAYADDNSGTGFTTTFDEAKDYIAIRTSAIAISPVVVSTFNGLWKQYKGEQGDAFEIDAQGPLVDRDTYDAEAKGFTFLDHDGGDVYIKKSSFSGDWSDPFPFIGYSGWNPILSVVTDGERRVLQIIGWAGGEGVEPDATNMFVGNSGIVSTAAEAEDIRGSVGERFFPDAEGDLIDRDDYDDELADFIYHAVDLGLVYIKLSDTSADWSTGFSWRGATGVAGPIGPAGTGFNDECLVATTADLAATYSGAGKTLTANANGVLTVDGVTPSLNARILVKNESTGADNGIYIATNLGTVGTPWVLTRADDFNTTLEAKKFFRVFIEQGTANQGTSWGMTNSRPAIVLDTTALVFTADGGSLSDYLPLSGGTMSGDIDMDGNNIVGSDIYLLVDGGTTKGWAEFTQTNAAIGFGGDQIYIDSSGMFFDVAGVGHNMIFTSNAGDITISAFDDLTLGAGGEITITSSASSTTIEGSDIYLLVDGAYLKGWQEITQTYHAVGFGADNINMTSSGIDITADTAAHNVHIASNYANVNLTANVDINISANDDITINSDTMFIGTVTANTIDIGNVSTMVTIAGTTIFSFLTASTLAYLDASKNFVSLANSAGVLTNNGSGVLSWSAGGSVTSVSGTSNRITSTGGTTPVIDISASYVGQSSITTVGALTSGSLGSGFTAVADAQISSAAAWNAKVSSQWVTSGSDISYSTGKVFINGAVTAASTFTLTSGATTNASPLITYTANTVVKAGDTIVGTGITAGTFIREIISSTSAYLTANATATNTGLTFTITPVLAGLDLSVTSPGTVGFLSTGLFINPIFTLPGTSANRALVVNYTGTSASGASIESFSTAENHLQLNGGTTTTQKYAHGIGRGGITSTGFYFLSANGVLVYQANGSSSFSFKAGMEVQLGSGTTTGIITGAGGATATNYTSIRLGVNTQAGGITATSGTINILGIVGGLSNNDFVPTSGTAVYNAFLINPTINQTSTASGTVRGIYYNPTATSVLGTHFAIETTSGDWRMTGTATLRNTATLTVSCQDSLNLTSTTADIIGNLSSNGGFSLVKSASGAGSGELFTIKATGGFASASSTATYNSILLRPTFNQSAPGVNGTIRGIYYNPTVTAIVGSHYALDASSGMIKLDDATETSSITTGSFVTAGGMAITKSLRVGVDLSFNASTTIAGAGQIAFTHGVGTNGYIFNLNTSANSGAETTSIVGGGTSFGNNNKTGLRFTGSWANTAGSGNLSLVSITSTLNQTSTATGVFAMIDVNPTVTSIITSLYGVRSRIAANPTGGGTAWNIYADGTASNAIVGSTMHGSTSTPTALLHLAAGTATASTSPLKFTSGTNLTTAEAGGMEYNGTNLFFTRAGTTRENVLVAVDNAAAPSTSVGVGIVNYYGSAATNFLGDPNRWLSVNVLGSVYKIPLYT